MSKSQDTRSFVLRVDAATMETLEAWADDEFRSINGQLQWILADALRRSGRLPGRRRARSGRGVAPEEVAPVEAAPEGAAPEGAASDGSVSARAGAEGAGANSAAPEGTASVEAALEKPAPAGTGTENAVPEGICPAADKAKSEAKKRDPKKQ